MSQHSEISQSLVRISDRIREFCTSLGNVAFSVATFQAAVTDHTKCLEELSRTQQYVRSLTRDIVIRRKQFAIVYSNPYFVKLLNVQSLFGTLRDIGAYSIRALADAEVLPEGSSKRTACDIAGGDQFSVRVPLELKSSTDRRVAILHLGLGLSCSTNALSLYLANNPRLRPASAAGLDVIELVQSQIETTTREALSPPPTKAMEGMRLLTATVGDQVSLIGLIDELGTSTLDDQPLDFSTQDFLIAVPVESPDSLTDSEVMSVGPRAIPAWADLSIQLRTLRVAQLIINMMKKRIRRYARRYCEGPVRWKKLKIRPIVSSNTLLLRVEYEFDCPSGGGSSSNPYVYGIVRVKVPAKLPNDRVHLDFDFYGVKLQVPLALGQPMGRIESFVNTTVLGVHASVLS